MSKIETGTQLIKNKGISKLARESWFHIMAESPFAAGLKSIFGKILHEKMVMYSRVGYWPQIKNPRSFNEKIAHRKHFTDRDIYSSVSDKLSVRKYVREKINNDVLNEVYHVTNDPSTIPFKSLPNEFVIKATHGSGWTIVVDKKDQADFESIRSQCQDWLSKEYGTETGEYWYDEIEPNIIIERRLHDAKFETPPDFKLFTFHGEVRVIEVDINRHSDHMQRFYDRDWNSLKFSRQYPIGPDIDKPENIEEMIEIAEKIGDEFDFARIDMYDTESNGIIFGEVTLAPAAGWGGFHPTKYDFTLGSYW